MTNGLARDSTTMGWLGTAQSVDLRHRSVSAHRLCTPLLAAAFPGTHEAVKAIGIAIIAYDLAFIVDTQRRAVKGPGCWNVEDCGGSIGCG